MLDSIGYQYMGAMKNQRPDLFRLLFEQSLAGAGLVTKFAGPAATGETRAGNPIAGETVPVFPNLGPGNHTRQAILVGLGGLDDYDDLVSDFCSKTGEAFHIAGMLVPDQNRLIRFLIHDLQTPPPAAYPIAVDEANFNPRNCPVTISRRTVLSIVTLVGLSSLSSALTATAADTKKVDAINAGLFEAMDAGQVDVKIIPRDATEANVLIRNLTDQPIELRLPKAFASVPIQAQFGGGGGGGGIGGGGGAVAAVKAGAAASAVAVAVKVVVVAETFASNQHA